MIRELTMDEMDQIAGGNIRIILRILEAFGVAVGDEALQRTVKAAFDLLEKGGEEAIKHIELGPPDDGTWERIGAGQMTA